MIGNRLTRTSRKQRRIRRSVGWSLFLAAALCLPTAPVWALGGGDYPWWNPPPDNGNGTPTRSAPEIDASVAVSALAVLTGGLLLVGDRVRKSRRNREG